MTHEHQCVVCSHAWTCEEIGFEPKTGGRKIPWHQRPFEKCGITQAAKVNGDGPFCNACRTGIMFLRYTQITGACPLVLLKVLLKREKPMTPPTPPNPKSISSEI